MANNRQLMRYGIWASAILLAINQFDFANPYTSKILSYSLSADFNVAKILGIVLIIWVIFNYREEI